MTASDTTLGQLVAAYELAQRNRIATGAHIRAAHRRADANGDGQHADRPLDVLYRTERDTEKHLANAMARSVEAHPAWPWMCRVRGIGHTLAARLLARLRIERAPTPSSFWQYCGLATVPGSRWECATCGVTMHLAIGKKAPSRHLSPEGGRCEAPLRIASNAGIRVAMHFPARGQRRAFDVGARTLCHLIGTSFLRRGGRYRRVYDARRVKLECTHPSWTAMHKHLTAMRMVEKLFLSHLWMSWHEAVNGGTRMPYEVVHRGRAGVCISPWEMVDR